MTAEILNVAGVGLAFVVLAVGVGTVYFIHQICWPHVLTYPWEEVAAKENKTVILAGSYNPPHNGHLVMLHYLATKYTKVVAVIGFNKSKAYVVTPQERESLLRNMLQQAPGCSSIEVKVVEGYIWRFADRIGASMFFRGIRSWARDGREERVLHIQNIWGPMLLGGKRPIPTVFLEGKPDFNHISSTLIRTICQGQEEPPALLNELVPEVVAKEVARLYTRTEST